MTETAPAAKPAPPIQILLTCGVLVLAAVAGLAASVAQLNAGFRNWAFATIKKADVDALKPGAKNPIKTMPTDAQIHSSVTSAVQTYLLMAVVGAVVVIMLAVAARRGKYWVTWAIIAVWVLSTLVGGGYGLSYLIGIGSNAPAAYKYLSFLAALLAVLAMVLVNLPPSRQYLNLSRPARPVRPDRAGARPAGLGGIFGPRAPRTVSQPKVNITKPDAGSLPRRVPVPAAADSGELTAASAVRPANRPRGKSRRT